MFHDLGDILVLWWRVLCALPSCWHHRRKIFEQFFEIGNASLLMACVLSLFIGGVLALQTGPVLSERGLSNLIGSVVGISMCKELAPVMMAVLIAGRIGSSMAAEIGSMEVYQEIDALKTMNIDPVKYLVLPRMLAISCALPMLVVFSILVGWVGGGLVSAFNREIHLTFTAFFNNLAEFIEVKHVANGILKSFIFAVMIGLICCHQGLKTIGGPRGIGRSVTKAVVNSLFCILLLDYFLTRLLLLLDL